MKAKNYSKDFPIVCVGGSAGGLDVSRYAGNRNRQRMHRLYSFA